LVEGTLSAVPEYIASRTKTGCNGKCHHITCNKRYGGWGGSRDMGWLVNAAPLQLYPRGESRCP